jgi:hypothetical protein
MAIPITHEQNRRYLGHHPNLLPEGVGTPLLAGERWDDGDLLEHYENNIEPNL